jgi:tripartite-type tricarboxylate transporter receptor subunit TctC
MRDDAKTGLNIPLTRRAALALAGGVAASSVPMLNAKAQGKPWPSETIKFVVPFTPGGSTDILARVLGQKLESVLGATIIIENKAGAGGALGAGSVAQATPDGHTFMMGHIGTLAFNPFLYPSLPYDPVKSFTPVSLVATVPNILAIHPSVPVNTLAEFIAYAKANPKKLSYGTGGNGSAAHIATAYFAFAAGIDLVHVPYRGTAPAVNDLLAGHIQLALTGGPALLPQIAAGKLKALAVSSKTRVDFAKDLPTIAEAAIPNFEAVQWYGLVAPAGTPVAIVNRMNAEINKLLDNPDIAKTLSNDGAIATKVSPEAFGAHIKSELALWKDIIARAGIKVES